MTPLDLTLAPPRDPNEMLAGVVFLPRTIDKIRASLPGGRLGEYTLSGLTEMQLKTLGIGLEIITAIVRDAQSDEEIAAKIEAVIRPQTRDEWNAFMKARKPGGGDPELALQLYPWLGERPDLIYTLEILPEDDRRTFRATR